MQVLRNLTYRLKNKRVVILAEASQQDKLNSAQVKTLVDSNEGTITARDLYERGDGSTFRNVAKIFICSNVHLNYHESPGDDAIAERLDCTPFDIKFVTPEEKKEGMPNVRLIDQQFMCNMRSIYLSELFSYFCIGACKYYRTGKLPHHERAKNKRTENLNLNSSINGFLDSEFVVVDPLAI